MKKALPILVFCTVMSYAAHAQQNYTDPGSKYRRFGPRNGSLDTISGNPSASNVNNHPKVYKYDRSNSVSYDNIKIYPVRKLSDVSNYATHNGNPPKIKMKLYSTAPVGTKIEIQLGRKGDDNYPSGVHSVYQAVTTSRNQWEELTFTFSEIPQGSQVPPTDVDKITLLFSPNTNNSDTYYFDDLIGPPMVQESVGAGTEKEQQVKKN